MGRVVCIPEGMTVAEGLRVVGGYSAHELDQIAREHPEKIEYGGIYAIRL